MRLLLALAVALALLVLPASAPAVSVDEPSTSEQVARWWAEWEDGGVLKVVTATSTFEVPMAVSSVLVPQDEDGNPVWADRTVVLRGVGGLASAAIILEPDSVGAIVNGPLGENFRLNVPETRPGAQPPEPEPAPLLAADAATEPPLFRGPLLGDSYLERVPAWGEAPAAFRPGVPGAADEPVPEVLVPMMHVAPQGGGSIRVSKHIWNLESPPRAIDPVNAIMYHYGTADNTYTALNAVDWWQSGCGSTKQALFYDAVHGGTDVWRTQARHYENDGSCIAARNHLRTFTSATGDTHSPGFNSYTLIPAHYENWGHSDVDPQRGQDALLADLRYSSNVGNVWFVQLTNAASECDNCNDWLGWVDFYNRIVGGNHDGCSAGPKRIYMGDSYNTIFWYC